MSDEIILEIIKTAGIILTAIISLVGAVYAMKARNSNKELKAEVVAVKQEQVKQVEVVKEYHTEVNGKMGLLIDTTLALGKEVGKRQEKEEEETDNIKDILDKNGIH